METGCEPTWVVGIRTDVMNESSWFTFGKLFAPGIVVGFDVDGRVKSNGVWCREPLGQLFGVR